MMKWDLSQENKTRLLLVETITIIYYLTDKGGNYVIISKDEKHQKHLMKFNIHS